MGNHPHISRLGGLFLAVGLFPAGGFAAPKIDNLQIQTHNAYQMQQPAMRQGVVDPYTGQFIDNDSFIESDYTSPNKSYRFEHQKGADQPALSYQVTKSLSLNVDPRTKRVDTSLRLGGGEKRNLKLKLNTQSAKVMFTYRF